MSYRSVKKSVRLTLESSLWRPSNVQLLWEQIAHRQRNRDAGFTDLHHLTAAVKWLQRAQDAMDDGGVCGRYRLRRGWTSSYPETTGYIIPTFLALRERFRDDEFTERARRCVEFLLELQLIEGAFPGGEVHENISRPSTFNTAQIISGLMAWHKASKDVRALDAAIRAADWLVSVQDEDGALRKFTFLGHPATYYAHASCWLAEFGRYTSNEVYLRAAGRHLDWVLDHQDPRTGWFDLSGFTHEDHEARRAVTHTIAYAIWGVLITSIVLERPDGIDAANKSAERVARRLELSGWLPGILDSHYRPRSTFACLTGNVQMALIWFKLYELGNDVRLVNAALKAIDLVKAAQPMNHPDVGIRGGIAGSDPLWGSYISFALPNWSAKFFIDALLAKEKVLRKLTDDAPQGTQITIQVPIVLPEQSGKWSSDPLKVVLYTAEGSHKVPQMLEGWSTWGFQPDAVVLERRPKPRLRNRIHAKIREDGLTKFLKRIFAKRSASEEKSIGGDLTCSATQGEGLRDAAAYCSEKGVLLITVESLETPRALEALRKLKPDLAIHAGAGILRKPVLAIPRLGTLNAHMGILPAYRGMNVAEWAAFNGGPVGCTVHLIDPGIDTGDILCARQVDLEGISSIAQLRAAVDREQIALLGEAVQYATNLGALPPQVAQEKQQGRQFFVMHADLRKILEEKLQSRVQLDFTDINAREES